MALKPTPSVNTKTMEEFQKEFRGKLYGAIAASLIAGLAAAVLGIWGYVKTLPGSVGLTPSGAVIAFDLKEGCPVGWSHYSKAWGRFLVGAVSTDDLKQIPGGFLRDTRGADLTPKSFGDPGGEEMHQLTIPEMPSHNHTPTDSPFNKLVGYDGGWTLKQADGSAGELNLKYSSPMRDEGGNQPHNNMPPYVALYFCRKD